MNRDTRHYDVIEPENSALPKAPLKNFCVWDVFILSHIENFSQTAHLERFHLFSVSTVTLYGSQVRTEVGAIQLYDKLSVSFLELDLDDTTYWLGGLPRAALERTIRRVTSLSMLAEVKSVLKR